MWLRSNRVNRQWPNLPAPKRHVPPTDPFSDSVSAPFCESASAPVGATLDNPRRPARHAGACRRQPAAGPPLDRALCYRLHLLHKLTDQDSVQACPL